MKSLKNLKVTSNHKILLVVVGVIVLILAFSYFHLGKNIEGMEGAAEIELEQITTSGPNYISSVDFSTDGSILAYGSVADQKAYIINPEDGSTINSFKYDGPARRVAITPNKKYLVVAGNSKLNILDIETGGALVKAQSVGGIHTIAVDPSGSYLVVGGNSVNCYNINESINSGTFKLMWSETYGKYESNHHIYSVAITDDSHSVIVGSKDQYMRVLDLETGNIKRTSERFWGKPTAVGINPYRPSAGKYVFSVAVQQYGKKRNVLILYEFDVTTNNLTRTKNIIHNTPRAMRDIKFLNNKYLVTGGDNAKLSFYNISTGKLVKNIDMGTFIYSFDLNSPNENKLAIGNYKTKLGLYNIILASDYESGTGTGSGGGSGGGSQDISALPEVSPQHNMFL